MTKHPHLVKWYTGAPPSIGWWNASTTRQIYIWRWWNGSEWSAVCYDDSSIDDVIANSQKPSDDQELICWSNYWPENAIAPTPIIGDIPGCRLAPEFAIDPNEVHKINTIKRWLLVSIVVLSLAMVGAIVFQKKREAKAARDLVSANMHFERKLTLD